MSKLGKPAAEGLVREKGRQTPVDLCDLRAPTHWCFSCRWPDAKLMSYQESHRHGPTLLGKGASGPWFHERMRGSDDAHQVLVKRFSALVAPITVEWQVKEADEAKEPKGLEDASAFSLLQRQDTRIPP